MSYEIMYLWTAVVPLALVEMMAVEAFWREIMFTLLLTVAFRN